MIGKITEKSVKVKVCGVRTVDEAVAIAHAGADWIGLNFHPSSPRSISIDRGEEIALALLEQTKARPVALFVDLGFDRMMAMAGRLGDLVQLHGDEDLDYLGRFSRSNPAPRVVRAFRLSDGASVSRMSSYLTDAKSRGCEPHAILVDAHVPGLAGGTGQGIDDSILGLIPPHPRLILAGGLTPENVAGRIERVRPWMVDVASGVESSPGVKDLSRVAEFLASVRSVSP